MPEFFMWMAFHVFVFAWLPPHLLKGPFGHSPKKPFPKFKKIKSQKFKLKSKSGPISCPFNTCVQKYCRGSANESINFPKKKVMLFFACRPPVYDESSLEEGNGGHANVGTLETKALLDRSRSLRWIDRYRIIDRYIDRAREIYALLNRSRSLR